MRGNPDRADTRATATMRDAKGFMQVQVADIRAKFRWRAMPNKRI